MIKIDKTAYITEISDCSKYTSDDKCINCGSKLALSDGTACVVSISGYTTYAAIGKCTACDSGKTPSSDWSTYIIEIVGCSTYMKLMVNVKHVKQIIY